MSVVAANLIAGPADVYRATFPASETGLESTLTTVPASATWTDMGGTQEGLTVNIGQEFLELAVDQVIDRVESRRTSRSVTVGTSLAEPTLDNFQWALNGGTIATGTGYRTYVPAGGTDATQSVYAAMIADGWAPAVSGVAKRRRMVFRKILNVEGIEFAYQKDGQTLLPVSLQLHFVSNTPGTGELFKMIDATV